MTDFFILFALNTVETSNKMVKRESVFKVMLFNIIDIHHLRH